MNAQPKVALVVVAAGRGSRAGSHAIGPKQYRPLGRQSVIWHTLQNALACSAIGEIVIVIHADDEALARRSLGEAAARIQLVPGGATRQRSVLAGLRGLRASAPDIVLVHDAARPFAGPDLFQRVIDSVSADAGALPVLPVVDTLKRESVGRPGEVESTVAREGLHAAQTPQGFPFAPLLRAHEKAAERDDFTDDSSIAEWAGIPVRLVEGERANTKLTLPADMAAAEAIMLQKESAMDPRTGNGYDVHRLVPGDHVTLCGIRIPHTQRLDGHSDADVGLHALTDALLATCGAGDIGDHFPPSDPQWKGASSDRFVRHAVSLIRERQGRIANADVTLICEAPKIAKHREAMRRAMAEMLAIAIDRVSVKATTNETIGFVGRQEGIAAIATASVVYPGEVE